MARKATVLTPDDEPENTSEKSPPANLAAHYRDLYTESKRAIRSRVELVTPKAAAQYLERNDHNRPMSPNFANRYASIMLAGEWQVNGQGLIRDKDGAILDGQHRLSGIVCANIAVPMLIIEGVDAAVFQSIDQGRKRDFAGYLAINGHKNTTTLAAAVRWMLWFEGRKEGSDIPAEMVMRPSISTLFAILDQHPGLKDSVDSVFPYRKRKFIIAGPMVCLHYLTTRRHPGKISEGFWKQLLTGGDLIVDSPVHMLRDTLIENSTAAKQYPTQTIMALTIKAFNATVSPGRKMKCLKFAAEDECFPEII